MTALDKDIAVARQTLADVNTFEVLRPSPMFSVAGRTWLLNHVMILAQENGPMTGNAPVGYRTSPGLMTVAAAAFETCMHLSYFGVHEDRLMAGIEHCSRERHGQRHTSQDGIASEQNRRPLSGMSPSPYVAEIHAPFILPYIRGDDVPVAVRIGGHVEPVDG